MSCFGRPTFPTSTATIFSCRTPVFRDAVSPGLHSSMSSLPMSYSVTATFRTPICPVAVTIGSDLWIVAFRGRIFPRRPLITCRLNVARVSGSIAPFRAFGWYGLPIAASPALRSAIAASSDVNSLPAIFLRRNSLELVSEGSLLPTPSFGVCAFVRLNLLS